MARKISSLIENGFHTKGIMPVNTHLSDAERHILDTCFTKRPVKRNQTVITDYSDKSIYFVEEGILAHYLIHERKYITFRFTRKGEFTRVTPFSPLVPTHHIQALYPGTVWKADIEQLTDATLQQAQLTQVLLRIVSTEISSITSQLLSFLEYTPQERYLQLMEEHSVLLQEVPLKHLASYIGITPQSLSRLRGRI
ncbi:MAG: hypothetical protein LBN06_09960 [Prevotellaceae bacterium]|nr:hypothetical protein [Prevotellaceae bacterium]